MENKQQLLNDLAKAKAIFQQRAIIATMGMEHPTEQCATCGDYHICEVPFTCETGDGA